MGVVMARRPWANASTTRLRGRALQRLRQRVLVEQGGMCAKCGLLALDPELDHITPISRGGTDVRSNLQVLCEPCHAAKTAAEFDRALPGRYSRAVGVDGRPLDPNHPWNKERS